MPIENAWEIVPNLEAEERHIDNKSFVRQNNLSDAKLRVVIGRWPDCIYSLSNYFLFQLALK